MKQHLEDDDLILHFYGETGSAAEPHLAGCSDCRSRYQALQRTLNTLDVLPAPHLSRDFESNVWQRLEPKLGRRRSWLNWFAPRRIAPVLAGAALVLLAFFAGRYSPKPETQVAQSVSAVRERVLLVAVGDHLERSKMLLVEIKNADPDGDLDLGEKREVAEDLVYTNRLYRQTAASAGDARVVSLLDDLERVLIEISHSPADLRGTRLQALRDRIENEGLIFKLRVTGSKLAQEETL